MKYYKREGKKCFLTKFLVILLLDIIENRAMNRFFFFLISIIGFSLNLYSAELKLKGGFYGENLIVDNPSIDNGFCVKAISINGNPTKFDISSNTFEIDLISLNLEYASAVDIKISHSETCIPKILNPEALLEKCGFTMTGFKQDKKTEELIITMANQKSKEPYIVEQYRWKHWMEVGKIEVLIADTMAYHFKADLYSNNNIFRIKQNSKRKEPCYSAEIKAKSALKEVTFLYDKKANNLTFSSETLYEIYDKKGILLKSGKGKVIDLSDLPWEVYFLNYDNTSIQVYL